MISKDVHFFDFFSPPILERLLKRLKNFSLVDLGCGDGRFLYILKRKGLLKNAKEIVGIDIAKERIERLKETVPFAKTFISDVQNLDQIKGDSFDVAISSQVIEHVFDDRKMVKEAFRILKPGGVLYLTTVIKKWYGVWVYWNKGFKLASSHQREYRSEEEVVNLLKNVGFKVKTWKSFSLFYPFLDLLLRFSAWLGWFNPSPDFYSKHKLLFKLRRLGLRPLGFKGIEVMAVKR